MAPVADHEHLSKESRWSRGLRALPILAWALLTLRALAMAEPTGPVIERMYQRSLFDDANLNVPLIQRFYGVGLIDLLFGRVTVAFAQLQFNTDSRAYWQSLVFLSEYAGIYGLLLLESCRPMHRSTVLQFPILLAFFAQLVPVGILGPLYFYASYVFAPIHLAVVDSRIDQEYVVSVLPAVLVAYYVPHFASYFNNSLATRHWWNWVWQLYGIWGSSAFFLFYKMGLMRCFPQRYIATLRTTIGVLAIISAGTYWYAILESGMSWYEIFVPKYLLHNPHEGHVALRTILQYDYISCFGAGLCWQGYHFWDLKNAGYPSATWARHLVIGMVTLITCGPGTSLLLMWTMREDVLGTTRVGQVKPTKKAK